MCTIKILNKLCFCVPGFGNSGGDGWRGHEHGHHGGHRDQRPRPDARPGLQGEPAGDPRGQRAGGVRLSGRNPHILGSAPRQHGGGSPARGRRSQDHFPEQGQWNITYTCMETFFISAALVLSRYNTPSAYICRGKKEQIATTSENFLAMIAIVLLAPAGGFSADKRCTDTNEKK